MPTTNILIVEDEQLVADFMKSGLEKLGYSIAKTVTTGEEAIKIAAQCRPDLVLMDFHIHGKMDAIEAARQICSSSNIPIIFVTDDIDDCSLEQSTLGDRLDLVVKPFSIEELQSTIEGRLNSRHYTKKASPGAPAAVGDFRYDSFFERAIQAIVRITQSGRLIDVNTRFAELLGYNSSKELLDSVWEAKTYFVNPEQNQELMSALKKSGFVKNFEFQAFRKDGTKVWLLQNICEIHNHGNNEPYYEGIALDITELKLRESAMKSLLTRNEALLNAVPDIIMEVDINRVYTWANKAGLDFFGDDIIGKEASYYFEGKQETYSVVDPLFHGSNEPIYIESLHRRRDGQKRLLAWRCHVYMDQDGKVMGALSSARDITDNRQAEEALAKSKERFRLIAEYIDEVFWITEGKSSYITYISPAFERIWGFPGKDLYRNTEHFRNAIHPEDREQALATFSQKGNGQPFELEYRIVRADGSIRYIWDRGFPVLDKAGRLKRYVGVAQDITLWKRSEEALEESKNYLNQIINCMGDCIFVKDRKHRHVLVNEAMCAWTGKRREEMIGKTAQELFPAEQLDPLFEQEWLVFETGKECISEDCVVDKQGNRHTVLTKKTLLVDEKGNKQIIGVVRDITERKQAEEALRESESRYRTAIECCNDGVAISQGMTNLFVNQRYAEIFGYSSPDEIIGKPLSLFVHPDDLKLIEEMTLRRQRNEPAPARYEIRGIRKDGESIDIEVTAVAAVYHGDTITLAYLRDVTERKRTEMENEKLQEQIRQSQKMEAVGVLAGGMAHDFNNLLSVINGYTELLLQGVNQNDPRRSDLEQIRQAGERAASLTSQLLAFSRKQMLRPAMLNLDDIISEMSKMLRRLIGEDIELVCTTHSAPELVYADQGQIQQIIMNLIVNARDAMPQGGKLTIETANIDLDDSYIREHEVPPGPYIMLAISDNGIGMDANTRSRIFEPFFTTKEPGKGSGMGLSTVYGIVKQSDGFIFVYSEPRKGTTFKIYFPRVRGENSMFSEGDNAEQNLGGTETVLLVEDERSVCTLTARILRERGYTVLEASNGSEALRTAHEFDGNIHLVLTDVVMPEMSGKILVSKIEAMRPGIKSLYISGYTDDAIVHHGILESNVAFLQKPFTVNMLASKVREVIDSHQLLK